jgi:hypothetical protein
VIQAKSHAALQDFCFIKGLPIHSKNSRQESEERMKAILTTVFCLLVLKFIAGIKKKIGQKR